MTPFDEILRRKRRARTPGFAGGELDDQLARDKGVDVLTPANREAITRPRTTGAMPDAMTAPPEAARPRAVSFDPATGRPNETFYRDKNDVGGLYDAYRNWEPHGGKRGFKNTLKSALLMGAEAVRANPDDPVRAAIAGLGTGAIAGTASPDFLNRLRRQVRLPELAGEVKGELERRKAETAIDMGQLVPVTLDNGEQVMVPARQAAALSSKQQEIGMRGDTLDARRKRWDQLGEHEAARDAQALYNSGAADDSAELRAEIARRLKLPAGTALPPRGLGNQIKLDDLGNYVVISPRSGAVTPTNQKSYEPTRQRIINQRQQRAIDATNARTQFVQQQTNQRAAGRAGGRGAAPDRATGRKAAELIGKIEQRRRTMTRADELLKANPDDSDARAMREKAQAEGEGFAAELNALDAGYEAGPGTLGYPYYKRSGSSSSSGVTEQQIRDAASQQGLDPEEAVRRARRRHMIP